jgi:hypothetical protein
VHAAAAEMRRLLEASGAGESLSPAERNATLAWIDVGWLPSPREAGQLFIFPGLEYANQCKTAAPEYDALVTASLLVARDHFPPSTLAIKSSAAWLEWKAGAELYERVLGREAHDPGLGSSWSLGSPSMTAAAAGAAVLLLILLWARKRASS